MNGYTLYHSPIRLNYAQEDKYVKDGVHERLTGDTKDLSGDCTYIFGECSRIWGNVTNLQGNVSNLSGDVTSLMGDVTGLSGDTTGVSIPWWYTGIMIGDVTGASLYEKDIVDVEIL
jgi:hypothetical protein